MKTVKTILNVLVVMLLLPIFVSLTTGVACVNMVKGEALSLLFVERTVLTAIKILKSTLELGVQVVRHAKDLISLSFSLIGAFVKAIVKLISNVFKLLKRLGMKAVKPMVSLASKVKTRVSEGYSQAQLFISSMFAFMAVSRLTAHSSAHSTPRKEESTMEQNDVCINFELELTDELTKLLKLDSNAPTLKASLTISKEVAMSLLQSLAPNQVVTA